MVGYILVAMVEISVKDLEAGEVSVLSRVVEICDTLASSCDSIRKHYWNHVRDSVTGRYSTPAGAS